MRKLVRSNARLASLGVLLALSPLFSSASGAAGLAPMSAPTASTVPLSHSTRGAVSGISYSGSSAGTNLNLSSSKANQSASNSSPVVITLGGSIGHGTILGGTNVVVSPGQLITPAEYAAVMQTLRGNQSLLLNTVGAAVGGSLTLNSKYVNDISSLLVPKNVSLDAVGYTSANPLNVKGTLADFGSIFALQNTANAGAVFDAANLAIGRGAVLSGSLPTGGDYKGSFASSDLTLNVSPLSASGNFVNNGSLLSNGNITVTAGGSIQNSTSGIISKVSASTVI